MEAFRPQSESNWCPRHEGYFVPCPICAGEAGLTAPEALEPETYRARMEQGEGETKLAEFGFATVSSEKHPDRNEDAVGIYPEEQIFAVFDGLGGRVAGVVASRVAQSELIQKYKEAQTIARHAQGKEEIERQWQSVVASNVLITEDETQTNADYQMIRNRELVEAQERVEALKLPLEVKHEAIAISEALIELSKEVRAQSKSDPSFKGMASTVAGVKLFEANSRRFAIFFSVGDSEAYLERARSGVIVPAVSSDGQLEHMTARKRVNTVEAEQAIRRVQAARAGGKKEAPADTALYEAKFFVVMQSLGQKDEVIPHISIWELAPGDRIALTTDMISDNDRGSRWQARVRNRTTESLQEVAAGTIFDAVQGVKQREGKGWDDGTAMIIEAK